MKLNQLKNELPKNTSRGQWDMYSAKSAFYAEADYVPQAAREQIKNELSNVFSLYAHKSGKFVVATLNFTGAGIEKSERTKHVIIDCREAEVDCEFAPSVKEAKATVMQLLEQSTHEAAASEATANSTEKPVEKPKAKKSKPAKATTTALQIAQ